MFDPLLLPVKRPLLSVESCSAIADKCAEEIAHLAEDGSLIAFNVSVEPDKRRCLRVLASSLNDYLQGTHLRLRAAETPAQIKAQITALFPAGSTTIRTDTFARILNVVSPQALRLIRSGAVQVVRAGSSGAGNSTLIQRESCITWLISRRVT